MIVTVRISAALLLVILAFAGCSEDTTKPEVPTEQTYAAERATLEGVVSLLAEAYEEKDIEKYRACLHPGYEFWFAEDNVDDPGWDWTAWIGLSEDAAVTDTMFMSQHVTDVRIAFTNLTTPGDSANFWEYQDVFGADTVLVFWAEFGVDMHVVEDSGEQEIDHWVDGRAKIYLSADPDAPGAWTICRIEDKGNEHKKTEKTSWSEIKALYRRGSIRDLRGSRFGLLVEFMDSHSCRSTWKYGECLHPDYTFHFSEDDLEDPSWTWSDFIARTEDVSVTDSMFSSESVEDVWIRFTNRPDIQWGWVIDDDLFQPLVVEKPASQDLTVYWSEFKVVIRLSRNDDLGKSWEYIYGRANMYTCQDPASPDLWTLWKIEDKGVWSPKSDLSEKATWSSLKAEFRP
jgi:hypothetical protein